MVNDERANGRQLGKGVRPRRDASAVPRELVAQVAQHVVTGMMTERHEKRAEKDGVLGMRPQTSGKTVRHVDEQVVAPEAAQGELEPGERLPALRAAVPGKGRDAARAGGQRRVQGAGDELQVPLGREQGRRKAQRPKAGRRRTHRRRRLALKAAVRHVRRCHQRPSDALAPQIAERLGQRPPHGPTARSGAHRHVGADRLGELFDESRNARVVLLARETAGYDQRVYHPLSKMNQRGSAPF